MGTRTSGSAGSLVIIAVIVGFLALGYAGVIYQNGGQYYATCWKKMHAKGAEADSPEQAAEWAKCEDTALAASYGEGFVFGGNPEFGVTPQLKAVEAACPSAWSDFAPEGAWQFVVERVQDTGGPTFVDKVAPAKYMVVRVFKARWPKCPATAAAKGFPRIVRKNDEWAWAAECIPCRAEHEAMDKRDAEIARWNALPEAEKGKEAYDELTKAAAAQPGAPK
jgi:hypothetical protein